MTSRHRSPQGQRGKRIGRRGGWLWLGVLLLGGCFQSTLNSAAFWANGRAVRPAGGDPVRASEPAEVDVADYSFGRGQLQFRPNFYLPRTHPMVEEMVALRGDIQTRLGMEPGPEPIQVYLFRSPLELSAVAQQLSDQPLHRRAFFLQTADSLSVFTSWSYEIAEDLRHELTHGYIHSVCPHLPLWLDEGLAEYFEVPRTQQGLHLDHVRLLAQYGLVAQQTPSPEFDWRLSRLEALTDPARLTQMDYALSWLWVATLLSTPQGAEAIAAELQARRQGDPERSLLDRWGVSEERAIAQVQKHLQGLVNRHRHQL